MLKECKKIIQLFNIRTIVFLFHLLWIVLDFSRQCIAEDYAANVIEGFIAVVLIIAVIAVVGFLLLLLLLLFLLSWLFPNFLNFLISANKKIEFYFCNFLEKQDLRTKTFPNIVLYYGQIEILFTFNTQIKINSHNSTEKKE